jgi:hypothetical protein
MIFSKISDARQSRLGGGASVAGSGDGSCRLWREGEPSISPQGGGEHGIGDFHS